MANNQKPAFTLERHAAFTFAIGDNPDKVYTMPPLRSMSFEEAKQMATIDDETDIIKKGEAIRDFVLRCVPELGDADISDMEYLEIFNAYAMSEGKSALGESKASRNL